MSHKDTIAGIAGLVAQLAGHTRGPVRFSKLGGAVRLIAEHGMRPIVLHAHALDCPACGAFQSADLRCFQGGRLVGIDPAHLTPDMELIEKAFNAKHGLVASWQRIEELEAANKSLRQTIASIALAMCATVERHAEDLRAVVAEAEREADNA